MCYDTFLLKYKTRCSSYGLNSIMSNAKKIPLQLCIYVYNDVSKHINSMEMLQQSPVY